MKDISHKPENEGGQIKTKLRNTCEKYYNVKLQNYQKRASNNLSKREDIIIMKQDKGGGVVFMGNPKCTEMQFQTLNFEPTKSIEPKVQRILRKMKSKVPIQDYKRFTPH